VPIRLVSLVKWPPPERSVVPNQVQNAQEQSSQYLNKSQEGSRRSFSTGYNALGNPCEVPDVARCNKMDEKCLA
jgi:hypothetical protein